MGRDAVDRSVASATPYADPYAMEFGFARGASRATHRRPRASLYAADFSRSVADTAWHLYSAFFSSFGPDHLPVEPFRLIE